MGARKRRRCPEGRRCTWCFPPKSVKIANIDWHKELNREDASEDPTDFWGYIDEDYYSYYPFDKENDKQFLPPGWN